MLVYFFLINLLTFFLYGLDKLKAKRGSWRIREATLLTFTILGGSLGALLGMFIWRHKKNKKVFLLVTFLSLLVHSYIIYYFKVLTRV